MAEERYEDEPVALPVARQEEPVEFINTSRRTANKELSLLDILWMFLKSSMPMAASYTFSLMIILMAVMAGRLDKNNQDNLAATTLISSALQTTASIAMSLLFAISIVGSNERAQLEVLEAENDENGAREKRRYISGLVKNGFLISTVAPVPIALMAFSGTIFSDVLGQNKSIARLAQQYLRIYSPAMLSLLIRMDFEQLLFSFRKQFAAMVLGLGSFAVGTGLAYLLGFGKFFFPKLGLAGIASGYVIESYLTCALFGLYLLFHKDFKKFNFFSIFNYTRSDFQQLKQLLNIGWPITLSLLSELSASFLISLFAGWLGKNELAAQNFAGQLYFLLFIPLFACAQTTSQLVSAAIGGKKYQEAKRIASYSLLTSLALIPPFCIVATVYPEIMKKLITDVTVNPQVDAYIQTVIPITAFGVWFYTAACSFQLALRASGDLIAPSAIAISNLWLGVLAAYLLGFKTDLGLTGVALGFNGGIVAGTICLAIRWAPRIQPAALAAAQSPQPATNDQPSSIGRLLSRFGLHCCTSKERVVVVDEAASLIAKASLPSPATS